MTPTPQIGTKLARTDPAYVVAVKPSDSDDCNEIYVSAETAAQVRELFRSPTNVPPFVCVEGCASDGEPSLLVFPSHRVIMLEINPAKWAKVGGVEQWVIA